VPRYFNHFPHRLEGLGAPGELAYYIDHRAYVRDDGGSWRYRLRRVSSVRMMETCPLGDARFGERGDRFHDERVGTVGILVAFQVTAFIGTRVRHSAHPIEASPNSPEYQYLGVEKSSTFQSNQPETNPIAAKLLPLDGRDHPLPPSDIGSGVHFQAGYGLVRKQARISMRYGSSGWPLM
jgi:hypothetical protein